MRIIPSFIEENSPPGERLIFSFMQNSSKNWIALHSLDLAPDNYNRRTELDFVLIIPEKGILCIEVKSQKDIYFDGSVWMPDSLRKNPFKQALDGRFAFHRRLKTKLRGKYSHVPVLHCCIFPFSYFDSQSCVSIKPWEFLDKKALDSCKSPDDFSLQLSQIFSQAIINDPQLSELKTPLTEENTVEIEEFCYPIRKRKPELFTEIRRQQEELVQKLRIQQKPLIKLCDLNSKVLVQGGAGTGKTLIGFEIAKRKAKSGKRVAYLCYNKLVGKWVESETDRVGLPNLIGGSIFSILLKLVEITPPIGADVTWWENIAPNLIEEKLTSPDMEGIAAFDYVIIDEAQDILARQSLWECTKLLFEEGVNNGSYLILGDFINQDLSINKSVQKTNKDELEAICTKWLLDENCRNYRSIGQVALSLSHSAEDTWSGYMREGGSLSNWDLVCYASASQQADMIIECIQRARNEGFKNCDITLLSFCAIEKAIFRNLTAKGIVIDKATELDSGNLRYSTVNAFKGMENKVIIITDVVLSPQSKSLERRVFYTGMTRATEKLFIVCRESSSSILRDWVLKKDMGQ